MRSLELSPRLVVKEIAELAAAPSFWLLLLATGLLVGHAFLTSTALYAEASGGSGGPAALAQGLNPLDGIVVPVFGAYDLVAMLLLPFVAIRVFSSERASGAHALVLQMPSSLARVIAAKTAALLAGWCVAGIAGVLALALWTSGGGHLHAGEVIVVALGHVLRGALTIAISAAAAAFAVNAASASIAVLSLTIGTWALDYAAAARGGWIASVARYTPSAALRVFERGELRVATLAVLLVLAITGLAVATAWLREGRTYARRARGVTIALLCGLAAVCAVARSRTSIDVSENRRNSFDESDEAVLRSLPGPLRIDVHLAAEDPRLADFERGVLAKLRRVMDVDVVYAGGGRTGLFAKPEEHYGEIWYDLAGSRRMLRATGEDDVLEVIYAVAGRARSAVSAEPSYRGYPLAITPSGGALVFLVLWPAIVLMAWWRVRRPRSVSNIAPERAGV